MSGLALANLIRDADERERLAARLAAESAEMQAETARRG